MAENPKDDLAIERIGIAREFATKEANRFLVVSVVLCLIYLAKAGGIGLDELVFGKKVSNLKAGDFVYLIGAQLSSALAQLRYSDSAAHERRLADLLGIKYGTSGQVAAVYPNAREWFAPLLGVVANHAKGATRFWFWTAAAPSMTLALIAYLLPTACGFYYIGNPLHLRPAVWNADPILSLVVFATLLNLLWFIQSTKLITFLENNESWADENNLQGK